MFILFLDSHKRVRKFISSLGKDERKRMKYVLITDSDMEDIGDLLPKKADVKVLQVLIPPQDIVVKSLMGHISKKDFQEKYYQYLTRPMCVAALIKIAKYCVFDNRDVVVCFGLYECDLNIPKYVRRTFESMFPGLAAFVYEEWKSDPESILRYRPENIGSISIQIGEYSDQVGRKLIELESCKDGYSDHEFYNDNYDD